MDDGLFRQEALDYQSATGAGFGAPTGAYPKFWSIITFLLSAFVVALLVFLFSVDFARKETVRGRLRVDGSEATLRVERAGTIREVFVSDGDLVEVGDPVARIGSERFMADGGEFSSRAISDLGEERIRVEQQIESTHQETQLSTLSANRAREDAVRQEREGLQQKRIVEARLLKARQRRDDLASLRERGLVIESMFNERAEAVAILEQSLVQINSQILDARFEQERVQTEARRQALGASREVSRLEQRLLQIDAEVSQADANASHLVRAPISGRVTALRARTGEAAHPDTPLAIILPQDAKLIAEIYVPSRAIGFVEPGKSVKLLYDAFPYQKFGFARGTIMRVSGAAQLPQEIGIIRQSSEALYRIEIALPEQTVMAYSQEMGLQAGMELTADIILEERRLYEWLIDPLRSAR